MADEIKPEGEGREVPLEDQMQTEEERDAKESAVLNDLLGLVDPESASEAAQEPQQQQDDPEATEAPEPSEGRTEPSEETPPADDVEYRMAVATLKRDGWSAEALGALDKDVVLSMGDARAKVQSDYDSAYAELVELRRGREGQPPGERTGSENEAEAPSRPDVKELAETLALDDEGAEVLAGFLQRSQEPLLQQMRTQREESQRAVAAAMKVEAELARRDLQEQFPQVRDPASYRKVLDRMTVLNKDGSYQDVKTLMEDSVLIEFRDEIKAQASEATESLRKARANGQPHTTTPDRSEKREKTTLTPEERESRVLELLDQGDPDTYQERLAQAREIGGSSY